MNRHLKRIVKKDAKRYRRLRIENAFRVYAKAYAKAFLGTSYDSSGV